MSLLPPLPPGTQAGSQERDEKNTQDQTWLNQPPLPASSDPSCSQGSQSVCSPVARGAAHAVEMSTAHTLCVAAHSHPRQDHSTAANWTSSCSGGRQRLWKMFLNTWSGGEEREKDFQIPSQQWFFYTDYFTPNCLFNCCCTSEARNEKEQLSNPTPIRL